MAIRPAGPQDRETFARIDPHMSDALFDDRVLTNSAYLIVDADTPVGVMHHCLFWDGLPYLSLIYLLEPYRAKGLGSLAMREWEEEMRRRGAKMVLTSTQADEQAQHFYRKLGYADCGGLILGGTPFDQPTELFLYRVL